MIDCNLLILITFLDEEENTNIDKQIEIDLKEFDSFPDFLSVISKKLNIKILPSKFDIKIFYENSWVRLIDLKSFYFFISNNMILNLQTKLLIKKKKFEDEKEVDFNLQGEKFEDSKVVDSNRPNMKIYNSISNPEVICSFCGDGSRDEYKLQKLGPFYGPVKEGTKNYYFHELCAIWTPLIFINANGKLENVRKEIKRSKKYHCAFCNEKGSGLGCEYINCNKFYHYLCAKSDGCYLNNQKYSMYCKTHKNLINQEDIDKYTTKDQEPEGYSDLLCMDCKSGLDEDKILICDKCGCGIHTYCIVPEVLEIPGENENFYCYKCINLLG